MNEPTLEELEEALVVAHKALKKVEEDLEEVEEEADKASEAYGNAWGKAYEARKAREALNIELKELGNK